MAESKPKKEKPAATPAPDTAASENAGAATVEKPAAEKKPKKEAVEDKPFEAFVRQDFLPALEKAFAAREFQDLELVFANNQVMGKWDDGQKQFTVYFPDGSIQGRKAFSDSSDGIPASTIESFLIDERKVTLDLLVFGVIQRINAQKWFTGN
jgi:Protein of unknown function (DUF2996)